MIHTDYYAERCDGKRLYRTASDNGVMIRKVGSEELFCEAIDVEGSEYNYRETDIPVPEDAEITVGYMMELLGELGVDTND